MTITAENLNLDAIVLSGGTELTDPPVITDAEGNTVDREATAELQEQLAAWGEVVHKIAAEAHGTKPTVSTEGGKELRAAYAELHVRGKAYARGYAEDRMREALLTGGEDADAFTQAIIWNQIGTVQKEGVEKPKAERRAKVEVSPTERAAEKLAVLRMAAEYITSNPDEEVDTEELDEAADAKVEDLYGELETYLDWETRELAEGEEKGEFEGELSPMVREAARLVLKKGRRASGGGSGRTYTGPRRSPVAHIEHAFSTVESGTFLTIAEIVAIPSPEYGDERPSSGAIAARLFPKNGSECVIEGIEAGNNADGRQGATKL